MLFNSSEYQYTEKQPENVQSVSFHFRRHGTQNGDHHEGMKAVSLISESL